MGSLAPWLAESGVQVDTRRPYAGEELPGDLSGHEGLLVLGGQMGCRDDAVAPWLPATRELLALAARRAVPTLGICLGHQLAAVALGGEVTRNRSGRTVGVLTVEGRPELADDPVFSGTAGSPVVQWNDDIVTRLPHGARALATNERDDLLLARLAPTVWGVQGHPEAGRAIVASWAEQDLGSAELAGLDVPAVLASVERAQARVDAGWRPVITAFAEVLDRSASTDLVPREARRGHAAGLCHRPPGGAR